MKKIYYCDDCHVYSEVKICWICRAHLPEKMTLLNPMYPIPELIEYIEKLESRIEVLEKQNRESLNESN